MNPFKMFNSNIGSTAATTNPFTIGAQAGNAQGSIAELLAGLGMIAIKDPNHGIARAAGQVFQNAEQQRQRQHEAALEAQRLSNQRALQEDRIQAEFGLAGFTAGVEDRRLDKEQMFRTSERIASFDQDLEKIKRGEDFQLLKDASDFDYQLLLNRQRAELDAQDPYKQAMTSKVQQDVTLQQQQAPLQQQLLQNQVTASDPELQLRRDMDLISARTTQAIREARATGQVEVARNLAKLHEASAMRLTMETMQNALGDGVNQNTDEDSRKLRTWLNTETEKMYDLSSKAAMDRVKLKYPDAGLYQDESGKIYPIFDNPDAQAEYNKLITESAHALGVVLGEPLIQEYLNVILPQKGTGSGVSAGQTKKIKHKVTGGEREVPINTPLDSNWIEVK